ncbi:MAG: hypothetical protein NT154_38615 [Verrucomicrobia bacterium]|nr:hypothetical protein [Verrucomicrobiota bacterium]
MKMKLFSKLVASMVVAVWLPVVCPAQVNTGSDGSDGAFNPTTNTVINMADHPNGIYQYTSVHIPGTATVTFIPNANNTPVVWLVQSNVTISGIVLLNGQGDGGTAGGLGGPGGFRGGNSGPQTTSGEGLGGGPAVGNGFIYGGNASYGSFGGNPGGYTPPGPTYGNIYIIPLMGGSGGGGSGPYYTVANGGGGGGAILIAASNVIEINGIIYARGGSAGSQGNGSGGGGSGGAVRLISARVAGSGGIDTSGGSSGNGRGGDGRVRFDTLQNSFGGGIIGVFAQGFQPIIIPSAGQLPQLTVTSVGGFPVSAPPTGVLFTPDAVISAQQNYPIPIVVSCAGVPLHTPITVSVKPSSGSPVSGTGYNDAGTVAASTANVMVNIPRGGGLIYATAATGH